MVFDDCPNLYVINAVISVYKKVAKIDDSAL